MAKNSVTLRLGSEGSEAVTQKLREIGETAKTEFGKVGREAQSAARGFDALERRLDPVIKANYDLARAQAAAANAVKTGARTQEEAARVIDLATQRHQAALRAAHSLTHGVNDNAKAVGLARHEWVNLSRQLQDVGVSLAGGASPFMVLTQQGGQIADVFSSSGAGAGAALRDFGGSILRFALNPVTLLAAGAAATGAAMFRWKEQTDALTYALNGLGRQAGLTLTQVDAIASRSASAAGISGASARGLAGQFLSAGVPRGSLGGAIETTTEFSRRLGVSLEDAATQLAAALADPARGAEELARKYGLVSFAQREQIKELAALGDRAGASAKLLAILSGRIADMEDPTWRITRLWERMKAALSDSADAWAKLIEETIDGADAVVKREQERQRRAAEAERQAQADIAAMRAQDLARLREDGALAVREISARSFAEREAIAMERARIQAMRETNDAVKAGILAENERAKLLAESARKADDMLRSAKDSNELSRLSPYDRAMREIDFKYRDAREQLVPNAASPMAREFDTAGAAATNLANSLNDAARRIGGGIIPIGAGSSLDIDRARNAIGLIESSNNYRAIGPRTQRGDRAYGRYQVMGRNIGPWSRDALGRSLSIEQFLSDPAAQDAIFNRRFGAEMMRYGNANDAASVWFTGRPLSRGAGARDVTGTSGSEYVRRFMSAFGGGANDNAPRRIIDISRSPARTPDIAGTLNAAEAEERAQRRYELILKPLQDANREIERQRAALHATSAAWGQSAEATARAAKEQELINSYTQQGVPLTESLRASIAATAENYGRLAAEQEEAALSQQRYVEALDTVRSASRDTLGGLASDLLRGRSAAESLHESLIRIADRLINMSLDMTLSMLLGKPGSANSGLLGRIFGFAAGGVMTSRGPLPLRTYSGGGIASSPQLAVFGEGSVPEAYVPVPSGRIPVNLRVAGGQMAAPTPAPSGPTRVVVEDHRGDIAVSSYMTKDDFRIAIRAYDQQARRGVLDTVQDAQRRAG